MKKEVSIYITKKDPNLHNYMPQICWLAVNRKYPAISVNVNSGMIPLSKIFFKKENIFDKSKTW